MLNEEDWGIAMKAVFIVLLLKICSAYTFNRPISIKHIDDNVKDNNEISLYKRNNNLNVPLFGIELKRENHGDKKENPLKLKLDEISLRRYRKSLDNKGKAKTTSKFETEIQSEHQNDNRRRREVIDLEEASKIRDLLFHRRSNTRQTRNNKLDDSDLLHKLDYSMEGKWKIEKKAHLFDNDFTRNKRTGSSWNVSKKLINLSGIQVPERRAIPEGRIGSEALLFKIDQNNESKAKVQGAKRNVVNLPIMETPY